MTSNRPLAKERLDAMKMEFLQLDANGDGKISTEELENVLRSVGGKLKASDSDIKAALKEIDRNGDGIIDLKEYYKTGRNKTDGDLIHRVLVQRSRIRREFTRFDVDSSGFVTKEEFLQVVRERGMYPLSPDRIDELIKEFDVDNDGKIDYEEFVVLMTN